MQLFLLLFIVKLFCCTLLGSVPVAQSLRAAALASNTSSIGTLKPSSSARTQSSSIQTTYTTITSSVAVSTSITTPQTSSPVSSPTPSTTDVSSSTQTESTTQSSLLSSSLTPSTSESSSSSSSSSVITTSPATSSTATTSITTTITTTTTTRVTSSSTTSRVSTTESSSATQLPNLNNSGGSDNSGVIVGATVGGILGVVLITSLLTLYVKRRNGRSDAARRYGESPSRYRYGNARGYDSSRYLQQPSNDTLDMEERNSDYHPAGVSNMDIRKSPKVYISNQQIPVDYSGYLASPPGVVTVASPSVAYYSPQIYGQPVYQTQFDALYHPNSDNIGYIQSMSPLTQEQQDSLAQAYRAQQGSLVQVYGDPYMETMQVYQEPADKMLSSFPEPANEANPAPTGPPLERLASSSPSNGTPSPVRGQCKFEPQIGNSCESIHYDNS